jgi:hypothetical protein
MVKQLLSQWDKYRGLTGPPPRPIQLWTEGGRSVWIANFWGPAVPYRAVDHGDGNRNHGYVRIKGNPHASMRIPEVEGWQELRDFLLAVNAADSPLESVGCEKAFSPSDIEGPTVKLGAYIDVIFTNPTLNETPENLLLLTSRLLPSAIGCENRWSYLEISLQRLSRLVGTVAPWGLLLRVGSYGRTQDEARKRWGETMGHLTMTVAALPKDFAINHRK